MKTKNIPLKVGITALTLAIVTSLVAPPTLASSHREAPMLYGDPKADGTDLYAFVSPDKTDTVTLIANYYPDQNPAGGPNFYNYDDNVLYEIKIDNNGDAVEDLSYQFRFKTNVKNPNTFLYNTGPINSLDDPDWNVSQTYTLTRVNSKGEQTVLAENFPVPPVNVGPKSTPNYGALQSAAIKDAKESVKVFAGQSDDPFFVDLGALFDLLTIRKLPGNAGGGVDALRGKNVLSLAIQVPISQITKNNSKPTDPKNENSVVGIWTTSSRQATRVLNDKGENSPSGDFVQISRLGHPLVNEVIVPVSKKDFFNASKPKDDAQFANAVANPELPKLLNALYGIKVPPQGDFGTPEARDDLTTIFLTGLTDLTKPKDVKPSEQLRLNVAVPVSSSPNNLGVVGNDSQGFPNGRRLSDDVVDISLKVMAGAAYPLFHPEYQPDPLAAKLGDGVDANDMPFRSTFPYMALPQSGLTSLPITSSKANTNETSGSNSSQPRRNFFAKVLSKLNPFDKN